MMIVNPAAATGVSTRLMRSSSGRISPIAPSTSHTPMNRRNNPGSSTGPFIISIGMTSFMPPANRKSAASNP